MVHQSADAHKRQHRLHLLLIGLGTFIGGGLMAGSFGVFSAKLRSENQVMQGDIEQILGEISEINLEIGRVNHYADSLNDVVKDSTHDLEKLSGQKDKSKQQKSRPGTSDKTSLLADVKTLTSLSQEPGLSAQSLGEHLKLVRSNATLLSHRLKVLNDNMRYQDDLQRSIPALSPVSGRISSNFGPRISPFTGELVQHNGVDIAASEGSDIVAAADGEVIYSGEFEAFGNLVVLKHGHGIVTRYAHSKAILVTEGQKVKRGEVIALVGSTGHSTGPHLHYEVWRDDEPINPAVFMKEQRQQPITLPIMGVAAYALPWQNLLTRRLSAAAVGGDAGLSVGSAVATSPRPASFSDVNDSSFIEVALPNFGINKAKNEGETATPMAESLAQVNAVTESAAASASAAQVDPVKESVAASVPVAQADPVKESVPMVPVETAKESPAEVAPVAEAKAAPETSVSQVKEEISPAVSLTGQKNHKVLGLSSSFIRYAIFSVFMLLGIGMIAFGFTYRRSHSVS